MTDTQLTTPAGPTEYSVSEISNALKRVVEDTFSYVRVRGEISGLKQAASGHIYFTLKDENSVLSAVCWKGVAASLSFKPEDGMEVICSGKITTYPGRSTYQLMANKIEVAGVGALLAMLEKRKKKLAAEGLFAPERKQAIPYMPKTIGVITSPTGAVIRDIIHRINDRFPVRVLLWGVLVQGADAAEQITAAIKGFHNLPDDMPKPDTLIVARGGGSIEDLWPFNEEIVVRAIADATIPVISAVGHETDTTLADYVADRRAPTPTAAAEMAVPVKRDLLSTIKTLENRLKISLPNLIEAKEALLHRLAMGVMRSVNIIRNAEVRLKNIASRLIPENILRYIDRKSHEIDNATTKSKHQVTRKLQAYESKLEMLSKLLDSYHYKKVLKRGFALVWDKKKILHSAGVIKPGAQLEVEFHDGRKDVIAAGSKTTSKKAVNTSGQNELF